MRINIHHHTQRLVSYLIMTFILCCGMAVHAQTQSVADAISACGAQKNSLKRLVCFDRIHANLNDYSDVTIPKQVTSSVKPSTAMNTSTPVTPHTVESSVNKATESFGQEIVTTDTMQAVITAIKSDRNNFKTITLNNGKVWKQGRIEDRARLSVGQVVTFEKGVFGAIYMSAEDSNRQLSVKRIK